MLDNRSMTLPLSDGTYFSALATSKCAKQVEISIKSTYRHGEADVEVRALDGTGVTKLQQWPGQISAQNTAGSTLSPDRERDGWVTFSNGKYECVYSPRPTIAFIEQ